MGSSNLTEGIHANGYRDRLYHVTVKAQPGGHVQVGQGRPGLEALPVSHPTPRGPRGGPRVGKRTQPRLERAESIPGLARAEGEEQVVGQIVAPQAREVVPGPTPCQPRHLAREASHGRQAIRLEGEFLSAELRHVLREGEEGRLLQIALQDATRRGPRGHEARVQVPQAAPAVLARLERGTAEEEEVGAEEEETPGKGNFLVDPAAAVPDRVADLVQDGITEECHLVSRMPPVECAGGRCRGYDFASSTRLCNTSQVRACARVNQTGSPLLPQLNFQTWPSPSIVEKAVLAAGGRGGADGDMCAPENFPHALAFVVPVFLGGLLSLLANDIGQEWVVRLQDA